MRQLIVVKTRIGQSYIINSTARQAAMVALKAKVKRLVVGHFSARYENEDVILKEAQELFPKYRFSE